MENFDVEMKLSTQNETQVEHNQLVSYVHAISDFSSGRCEIWLEHSYARRGVGYGAVNILLAPQTDTSPKTEIDIETITPEPAPPDAEPTEDYDDDDFSLRFDNNHDEDWESKAKLLAPSKTHSALITSISGIIRDMQLQQLSGVPRRDVVRYFARRFRRILAPLWGWVGLAAQRPAAWAHSTLLAYMPRLEKALYIKLVEEVRRSAPRLTERIGAGYTFGAAPAPAITDRVPADADGPWAVWVRGPCARTDGRWERALSGLIHVRVIPDAPYAVRAAPPDKWCADVVVSAQAALSDVLAEAGERAVVVCGQGAGAALAAAAGAAVPGARALALLAPPLITAEGTVDSHEDAVRCSGMPTLLVAPASAHSLAMSLGARRTTLVAGTDYALRLPPALRRRWRVSERALDAVIAEEVRQWVLDVAEGEPSSSSSAASPRRSPLADDFAHLPPSPQSRAAGSTRHIEIVEGRVVSRVSGGTPLALVPPRRPAPPAHTLDDIMHMPIVFADDEPERNEPGEDSPGRAQLPRIVVAKRGRGRPRGTSRYLR